MGHVPTEWIVGCTGAHRRLEAAIATITNDIARRPSTLEGWTVGHILNHLARNADSHALVFEAAGRCEVRAQYPGGQTERAALIEDGAQQPAEVLIANIGAAHQRLEVAWARTGDDVWANGLGLRTLGAISVAEFVYLRWREVELHGIDLGLADQGGPHWDSISAGYVEIETAISLRGLPGRLPDGVAVQIIPEERPAYVIGNSISPPPVRGSERQILRWLTGRGGLEGWPVLGPW